MVTVSCFGYMEKSLSQIKMAARKMPLQTQFFLCSFNLLVLKIQGGVINNLFFTPYTPFSNFKCQIELSDRLN